MELEKRLERWDALFEELKEVVEHFIPSIEKSVNEAITKVNAIEQRVQNLEAKVESIEKAIHEEKQDVAPESFMEEISKLEKEFGRQVESLRKELQSLRATVGEGLKRVSGELDSKIEFLKESIHDTSAVSAPEGDIKRLEMELEALRETVGKLHKELEHVKTNMVERHRILREKKVEGRSPRLL